MAVYRLVTLLRSENQHFLPLQAWLTFCRVRSPILGPELPTTIGIRILTAWNGVVLGNVTITCISLGGIFNKHGEKYKLVWLFRTAWIIKLLRYRVLHVEKWLPSQRRREIPVPVQVTVGRRPTRTPLRISLMCPRRQNPDNSKPFLCLALWR